MANINLRFSEKLFLLSVIIASGTLFNIAYSSIVTGALIGSVLLMMVTSKIFSITRKSIVISAAVIIFLLGQSVFIDIQTLVPNIKVAIKFGIILIGINILIQSGINFLDDIARISTILMAISFIIYLSMIVGLPLPTQSIPGQNYQGILYFNVKNIAIGLAGSGITIPRNFGIYWEPGLYQVYLNMLVLYYLYNKRNIPMVVFVIVNIVLTFSPTGYITTFIIVALYIVCHREGFIKKSILVLGVGILLIAVFPWFSEFLQFKITTTSFEWRFHDIIYGLKTFLRNPIFGIGTSQEEYKSGFYSVFGAVHGNTNGLISIAMEFGIFGIIFYSYNLIWSARFWASKYGVSFSIAFLSWIVCALINEPIERSEMLMLFLAIGVVASTKLTSIVGNDISRRAELSK